MTVMRTAAVLAAQAARLNAQAGSPAIPSLYFMTDPARVADPLAAIRHLPAGTAVIYRHFGAPDRARMARRLAQKALQLNDAESVRRLVRESMGK